MTTKDKLELLWKYLLLVVLVYGFFQIGRAHHPWGIPGNMRGPAGHNMMWFDDDLDLDDMDVNVDITRTADSDSTVVVTINGETVDPDDLNLKELDEDGTHVFVKKMKHPGKSAEHRVTIIRREIDSDDQ